MVASLPQAPTGPDRPSASTDADRSAGAGDPILRVRGLSKTFRGLTALSDYDLDLPAGRIHGVIGPNGAGKTTLFHVLSGFLRPIVRLDRVRGPGDRRLALVQGRPARHRPDVPEHPPVR